MILLVGGTGSLGRRIAHGLLERREVVRALARPGSDHRPLEEAGAEIVFGDLKDPASLATACDGVEIVITTANSARRGGEDDTDAVDRRGNRALIDAAREAGVSRFVFVSALGADPASPIPFLRAKGETEAHLRESGLEYTIVSPNVFMDSWFPMLVEGPFGAGAPVTLVGAGQRRHSFVAERDVAAFVLAVARHPSARNATVVVGGPEPLSWRDVVGIYEEVEGRSIEVRTVPPGSSLPGLPDIVSRLAAGFDTYDSPIPMHDACATFGVNLTPAREFAARERDGSAREESP